MSKALLLIILLAAAMLLGPVLVNNPGYIKVVLAGYSLEMTLLGLLLVLLLGILLLALCWKLFAHVLRIQHLSFNFFRWRRQRKAQQAFTLGLQAYTRQQWPLASEQLQLALRDPFMADEKRIFASYAAFYAGEQATASELAAALPEGRANSSYVQADLLLQQGKAGQACALLQAQLAESPKDNGLGQLYLYALQQAGQWQQMLEQVPLALKYQWFSKQQWQQQRFTLYPQAISELSLQQAFSEQAAYWQALPAKERKSAAAALGMAWALAQQGKYEQAELKLLRSLTLEELPLAWPSLRQIPLGQSVLKLRKQAQQWLKNHGSDAQLYALLAYLAEQEGDTEQAAQAWHKARQYQPGIR
ncbi:heme biosynthesis protein HemY [Arsukibacterium sp.]|uniref:heme biosynthesis protein HemY n=1 Tax=Arsukibacterium sp. TaxID=1977258 RepID=UPI002FD9EABE